MPSAPTSLGMMSQGRLAPLLLCSWAAQLPPSLRCCSLLWVVLVKGPELRLPAHQMPAAAQSWDNCSYLFLLFSRPRRVFQERTFHSMMTCKSSPSIYISNSKSAVSKFEPGLGRRIMGQMQLAAQRAAYYSLIYFFAHQIPRILVLKSNETITLLFCNKAQLIRKSIAPPGGAHPGPKQMGSKTPPKCSLVKLKTWSRSGTNRSLEWNRSTQANSFFSHSF